ncbi:IclR family transcriptional regulator [Oceaniglobus ichthyenteri]|uniref:IclR family transcriptional regulator n=1 Tax=Oceaniglobus ichthyenteri TaxID=2136177 RepID=UPI000D39FB90|nr:IclR family transcriptional regulator [Oceaniglobus ichthyenteri]
MAQDDRQFVDALARGLAILEALSRAQRPQSNGEIAKATDLAPSTVSRLTHTLTVLGYTRQSGGSRAYELTPKNLSLGYPILAGMSLIDRARPLLKQLAETTGETAALAIRDGLHITFVEVVTGSSIVSVRLAMGGRLPISASAAGISLLAAMPERDQRTLAARVRSYIDKQGGDLDSFNRCYARTCEDGIAIIRDVWRPGIGGLSFPVRSGSEMATLTIPVATGSVSERTMRGPLADALKDMAARLSAG